jgi:mono/diheme cytochrome c family protein
MRLVIGLAVVALAVGGGLWLAAHPTRAVASSADAGAGAEIAARWCAGCHVVAPSGAGTDAAPSFMSIALTRTPARIRAFLRHPHGAPMQSLSLSGREIDDVTAYIVGLGRKAHTRRRH